MLCEHVSIQAIKHTIQTVVYLHVCIMIIKQHNKNNAFLPRVHSDYHPTQQTHCDRNMCAFKLSKHIKHILLNMIAFRLLQQYNNTHCSLNIVALMLSNNTVTKHVCLNIVAFGIWTNTRNTLLSQHVCIHIIKHAQ